jgi:serine-type D-Ala-D-Ala carboxypeptidase/endopeptidase
MVADGKMSFTDRFQDRLGWDGTVPELDGKSIRLIDLAPMHRGCRESSEIGLLAQNEDRLTSKEDDVKSLKEYPLLLAPGAGMLYSNFGFIVEALP